MEAVDTADELGRLPLYEKGFLGIRTDFMDVEFKKFVAAEL